MSRQSFGDLCDAVIVVLAIVVCVLMLGGWL